MIWSTPSSRKAHVVTRSADAGRMGTGVLDMVVRLVCVSYAPQRERRGVLRCAAVVGRSQRTRDTWVSRHVSESVPSGSLETV
jgi:hypothetical protein